MASGKRRFQLRQYLEQIPHQPDVRNLEDRCLAVLVDGHNRAGVLDAGQVLDRAADADGHVQVRGDDLAGLADLQLVGHVAGVDRGARGADGGRSEEHTSELQSIMRITYDVYCLNKTKT